MGIQMGERMRGNAVGQHSTFTNGENVILRLKETRKEFTCKPHIWNFEPRKIHFGRGAWHRERFEFETPKIFKRDQKTSPVGPLNDEICPRRIFSGEPALPDRRVEIERNVRPMEPRAAAHATSR